MRPAAAPASASHSQRCHVPAVAAPALAGAPATRHGRRAINTIYHCIKCESYNLYHYLGARARAGGPISAVAPRAAVRARRRGCHVAARDDGGGGAVIVMRVAPTRLYDVAHAATCRVHIDPGSRVGAQRVRRRACSHAVQARTGVAGAARRGHQEGAPSRPSV